MYWDQCSSFYINVYVCNLYTGYALVRAKIVSYMHMHVHMFKRWDTGMVRVDIHVGLYVLQGILCSCKWCHVAAFIMD